jgi:hypothetical protein
MVLPDLNFTPPEEDDVHIPEVEHAGTLSTAKQSCSFKYIKLCTAGSLPTYVKLSVMEISS